MSLKIAEYQRKPFTVQAIQVTVDNMQEVAEWCGGEVILEQHGARLVNYIKVDIPDARTERQKKAFVQDWVLKTDTHVKCYSKKAFPNTFEKSVNQLIEDGEYPINHNQMALPIFKAVSDVEAVQIN